MHHLTVEISLMVIEDLDEIVSIENTSFSVPWSRNMFLQELQLQMSRNIVARISVDPIKIIAGYMTYWIVDGEIQIHKITTRVDFRRSGIASKLMEEMIRHSSDEGCTWCTLEVGRSNENAIKLYEEFGFSIQGLRPLYYSERVEDALIMGANLKDCMKSIRHDQ
jgi:[ribosomal protein S18]-alanine N-acetyltransferase